MPARPVHVAKFGGTSVGTPERVRGVVALSVATPEHFRRVVVVSAFGGVTDRLIEATRQAEARDDGYRATLDAVRQRHDEALAALVLSEEQEAEHARLDATFTPLRDLLDGVFLLRECTPRFLDAIVSTGERASAPLVAAAFRAAGHAAVALDATRLIRTDDTFGEAAVDFAETRRLVQAAFAEVPDGAIPVVTGFVGATPDGVTTTLGRSGSDYTATILAGALDAEACVIWTDVDGVLSADPRVVEGAFTLPTLSYQEAGELAHFGAKVLHPRTMRPLQKAGIPLLIKNTLNPDAEGTRIGPRSDEASGGRIKGVTAARGAALIRLDGAGVLGVPELAARAFGVLARAEIAVLLIAQASAEGSLCFAVREGDADESVRLLEREFERECARGDLVGISAEGGAAVVAAVGALVREAPGLAGRVFDALGRAHVHVRAIAEGASETNLSAVVADADALDAVRALHEAFALERTRAHVFVVGAGGLGRKLLALLEARAPALCDEARLNLRLAGLADSRRLVWTPDGRFAGALDALENGEPTTLDDLVEQLAGARLERLIVVDATASDAVASRHAEWLEKGIAVVTPNKGTTRDAARWQAARDAARRAGVPYLYDTTVGAGLNLVATLRDLVRTGDHVEKIEGLLSGTLSFVFGAMRGGAAFSAAVAEARARGLTEPDPRDDLSGADAARKLVTLARELGVEPSRIEVESLVPEALRGGTLGDFLAGLAEYDDAWRDRIAGADGAELQYVARLHADGTIRAGVEALPAGSPFAGGQHAPIAVAFHTQRYGPEPLVLRGPGASADVTAAVLLADVVRAAEAMR